MGSRLKGLALLVAIALPASLIAIAAPVARAESSSPSPESTATTQASPRASATASAAATATAKASTKASTKASAKPTPTKKKVTKKGRAKVRVTPSPKPVWPPKGFRVQGEVYAKVPTAKELVGLISANKTLQKQIKECSTYICASVQVASEIGCKWWEVITVVSDAQGNKLGDLTNALSSSAPKEFKTIIVVSPEFVEKGGTAKIVSVICHHEDRMSSDPKNNYKKVA